MRLGTENKRQLYLVIGLFSFIFLYGGYQIYRMFGGGSSSAPVVRVASVPGAPAGLAAGPAAKRLSNSGLDPTLHLERLMLNESVEYSGTGRNIFSAESAPVIEAPIKSARDEPQIAVPQGPPPPPKPPAIELKYFGYAQSKWVAEQLVLALNTVKRHISNIFGKLGASSRTQAVAQARALGLLDP